MYHLRLKGDHYQMGVKRGNIFQKAHISFPLQLDNFQLEHGKQSEEILRKFFPEICEEVRGVSDAIGTDYLHFISWMLCMGCCMYNLENNKLYELLNHRIFPCLSFPLCNQWLLQVFSTIPFTYLLIYKHTRIRAYFPRFSCPLL